MNTQTLSVSTNHVELSSLASMWDDLLHAFPSLIDVVWDASSEAKGMQFSPGPPPTLFFPADASLDQFTVLLRTRPVSCELVASRLTLPVAALSPLLLRAFIFLHECGHAVDFVTRFAPFPHGDRAEDGAHRFLDACMRCSQRQEYEMLSLPIPLTPSGFLAARQESPEYLFALLQEYYGLTSPTDQDIDRVFHDLERAYKALPSEVDADRFAAQYIADHPWLLSSRAP